MNDGMLQIGALGAAACEQSRRRLAVGDELVKPLCRESRRPRISTSGD